MNPDARHERGAAGQGGQWVVPVSERLREAMRSAIDSVTDCAAQMPTEAASLQGQIQAYRVPEAHTATVRTIGAKLDHEGVGAVGVLEELRTAAQSGQLDPGEVLRVLTELETRMMSVLAEFAELSEELEKIAETDEACEPAFVLVIETAGRLLQRFRTAQSATHALRSALPAS